MTTDEPVIEETRIHPGDKYRPDGTFDLTLKIGWAELEDEETRRVDTPHGWRRDRRMDE